MQLCHAVDVSFFPCIDQRPFDIQSSKNTNKYDFLHDEARRMSESEKVYFSVTIDYSIYRQLVRLAFMSTPFHSSLLTAILVWQHVQKLGACKPSSLVFGLQTDKLVEQISCPVSSSVTSLFNQEHAVHPPAPFLFRTAPVLGSLCQVGVSACLVLSRERSAARHRICQPNPLVSVCTGGAFPF